VAAVGLYWFGNDLRLSDQAGLLQATADLDALICLYTVDPAWSRSSRYRETVPMGGHRRRFLFESLRDLDDGLRQRGQQLLVLFAPALDAIPTLITRHNVTHLYRSVHAGHDEQQEWQWLVDHYPQLRFISVENQTLFNQQQLPFALSELPASFSRFRKQVETLDIAQPLPAPQRLPPSPLPATSPSLPLMDNSKTLFQGGERSAMLHRQQYFDSTAAHHYKQTRNALDGALSSTRFSPWLANGCQSARQVLADLRHYEAREGSNESTYWIYFELLWREYFQWYARRHGKRLFLTGGPQQRSLNTTFYPERFRKWCAGNTPYPIVNACMKQLNATGFMSNRGRQLVASCLVNELSLNWRYGAAYFEQQLIDYDVASNWGNWQYIAGVGADPRGGRHFNLDKQAAQYDPDSAFISHWQGDEFDAQLDSVDAADWPIGH